MVRTSVWHSFDNKVYKWESNKVSASVKMILIVELNYLDQYFVHFSTF